MLCKKAVQAWTKDRAVLQLRASYYSSYAHRLASWGYAVVQYDADRFPILTDRQEVVIHECLAHAKGMNVDSPCDFPAATFL